MDTFLNSLGAADFVALALALVGLAVVVWEVAVKDPRSFLEMATDSRRFAEPSPAPRAETAAAERESNIVHVAPAAVVEEEHRLAA